MVVEQDDVRLQFLRLALRLAGIGGVAHDYELRVACQQRGQAAPEQRVVVDDENPDRGSFTGRSGAHAVLPP